MSVATSYARAVFDSAGQPTAVAQVEKELELFSQFLDSTKDLGVALLSPLTTAKEKRTVVEQLGAHLGLSTVATQSLKIMARQNRLGELAEIRQSLMQLRLKAEGAVAGKVVSAEPMTGAALDELTQAFSKKLGMPVKFQVSADPALLAGVRVTVNGVTYDGSLRSQLARLRDRVLLVQVTGSA